MNVISTLLIQSPQHIWEDSMNRLAMAFIISLGIGLISSILYCLYFMWKNK